MIDESACVVAIDVGGTFLKRSIVRPGLFPDPLAEECFGSVRVDPDASTGEALESFAHQLRGYTVKTR